MRTSIDYDHDFREDDIIRNLPIGSVVEFRIGLRKATIIGFPSPNTVKLQLPDRAKITWLDEVTCDAIKLMNKL